LLILCQINKIFKKKKMLSITSHQENANQNHNDITSNPLVWLLAKKQPKQKQKKTLVRMYKSKPYGILVGMLNGTANVKNGMTTPQYLNIGLPYDPTILFLAYIQKNWKQRTEQTFAYQCAQ